MKHILLTLTLAAAALFAAPAHANTHATGETITVSANGLICDFCARALEKVFKSREDVADIAVDLTAKTIVIEAKTAGALDDATVTKLVTDAGYSVTGIARAPSAHHGPADAPHDHPADAQVPAPEHDHDHDHGEGHSHE